MIKSGRKIYSSTNLFNGSDVLLFLHLDLGKFPLQNSLFAVDKIPIKKKIKKIWRCKGERERDAKGLLKCAEGVRVLLLN